MPVGSPMSTYTSAYSSFFVESKVTVWEPDTGVEAVAAVTAPATALAAFTTLSGVGVPAAVATAAAAFTVEVTVELGVVGAGAAALGSALPFPELRPGSMPQADRPRQRAGASRLSTRRIISTRTDGAREFTTKIASG